MDDYAIVETKGRRWIKQIITSEKKQVVFDGRDENGKMKFREPKLYDDIGNGDCVMFLGTEQECIGKLSVGNF